MRSTMDHPLEGHPLLTSVLVMLIVAVPGYLRMENIVARQNTERQDRASVICERTVEGRDDNRSMWLFAFSRAAPSNTDLGPYVAELNRRLPPLKCVDSVAVPVSEP